MRMRIRELRYRAMMTQRELAKAMRVSGPSVHAWETGKALPTADKLAKLAQILGCSVDDLFAPGDNSIVLDSEG